MVVDTLLLEKVSRHCIRGWDALAKPCPYLSTSERIMSSKKDGFSGLDRVTHRLAQDKME